MSETKPRPRPVRPVPQFSPTLCHIDELAGAVLRGWALDQSNTRSSPMLHFIVDGQEIQHTLCDVPREDVVSVTGGFDRLGFDIRLPPSLADSRPHRLQIRDWRRLEVPLVLNGQQYHHVDFKWDYVPTVHSFLDGLRYGAFEGWVTRTERLTGKAMGNCAVRVACDGLTIGHVRANQHRGDVARITGGPPDCGFRFEPPRSVFAPYPRAFSFYLMPENIELVGSPVQATLVVDEMQRRLIEVTDAVDAMHRELTRLRRQLHEITPKPRYSVANYDHWFKLYEPALIRRVAAGRPADAWADGPLVSVLCPVYRPAMTDFKAAIESVLGQSYRNLELILVDDNSKDQVLTDYMAGLAAADSRVRLIKHRKNLGISGATNTALKAARGEWIAFFDHDDALVEVAIECMVEAALRTGADVLYSDEDKLDSSGHVSMPAFKTDWNHRLMLGVNYVCHLLFVRRTAAEAVGALDSKYDGAQDHDYILRLAEHVDAARIHHVPEVLYHWRITAGSTADTIGNKSYAVEAGVRAVSDHLARLGRPAKVGTIMDITLYRQDWMVTSEPDVTVIIPYKDQIETTERCLNTLLSMTRYKNFDVILVDNWSTSHAAEYFAERVAKLKNVRIKRVEESFNYSRINNLAARETQSEYLVFMNNDLFVTSPGWLHAIVGEAMVDPKVGAVGGKFLYPNGSVQHAGVIVGLGGVAGAAHVGQQADHNGYAGRMLFAQEMSAVTAAGMLVRRTVFDEVGGFDEVGLPVAFNDVDLCLKIRKAGYKIIWTPDFLADHHESFSRGDDERPMQETRFFNEIETMKERWGDTLTSDPFYHPKFSLTRQAFFDLNDPA